MKLCLLDLPNELLFNILSYHTQVKFDKFKNVRNIVNLSKVCRRFYNIVHKIKNPKNFIVINYISICNNSELNDNIIYSKNIQSLSLNKDHYLFKKNILSNWRNINIILSIHFKYDLSFFDLYRTELAKYKNIHISFNIEYYIDDFIEFYDTNKDYLNKNVSYSINIHFYNDPCRVIKEKLKKVRKKFHFRNITFNKCCNFKIPSIKVDKLKIYNCKSVTFSGSYENNKKLYIKNSRCVVFDIIRNISLLQIRCSYNVLINKIENVNQLSIIESRIIFNHPIININLFFIKMIRHYFIIPDDSIIFRIVYLYKYYIEKYTKNMITEKYNIDNSDIKRIDLFNSSKCSYI